MKTTTTKSLFDTQVYSKVDITNLENHGDIINANIVICTILLAQLLPGLSLQAYDNKKLKPEVVLNTMGKLLGYIFRLSEACNYELPDEEDLSMFEDSVPAEVKNDAVLTVMGMMGAFIDIIHIINVDFETPIWTEEEIPEEFEDDIFTIVIGIKNLGQKYNFTLSDVISSIN